MAVASVDWTRNNWRIWAATMDVILPEKIQHAHQASPTLAMFMGEAIVDGQTAPLQGAGRLVHDSGHAIVRRVTLGKHAGAGSKSGPFGEHNVAPDDNTRFSEATWKFYDHGLAISEHDRRTNTGKAQIANFLNEQSEEVVEALADVLAADLFNAAGGGGANDINSLHDLINADSTVMSLAGGTFTQWNSRGLSNVGTAPGSVNFDSGSFASQGLSDMRTLVNNATEGGVRPNVIVTSFGTHERYEAVLQPQERFAGAVRVADGSFQSLAFRTIPVIPERYCADDDMFALLVGNSRHGVRMDCLQGATMTFGQWKPSYNQTAMVRPLEATCNLSIGNRQFGCNKMESIAD